MAVARRWRRPSPMLHALVTAAERQVRDETPLDALAAGTDPLAVLAALLKAPAPAVAGDPMQGQVRRLAPAAGQAQVRHAARAAVDATKRGGAAPDPPVGIGARRAAMDGPDALATVATGGVTPPRGTAGKPPDRLDIARARTALRRLISALPDAADAPKPTGRDGADPSGRRQPRGYVEGEGATHGLVAAANAAAAARRGIAETGAEATGRVVDLGRAAPHASGGLPPSPLAPLSDATAAFGDRAAAAALRPAAPQAQVARLPAHAPVPAPRRSAAMPGLDDGADALAEDAWRNGVTLS